MKRAKKSFWFLAGILLLLGFCFREDVLASSLTSLPSLSKAGIMEKLYHRTLLLMADMILPR